MKIEMEIKNGKIVLKDEILTTKKFNETECLSKSMHMSGHEEMEKMEKMDETKTEEETKQENVKENIMDIVREVFESKLKDLRNPNRFNTGDVKITMQTIDRPDLDQIADIDKDIPGYDRIRVFDSMKRKADVTVICDGPDSIYFIVNRKGLEPENEEWSQAEIMLYPGEAWKIFDVYEIRIRSETQANKYRITEDEIVTGSTIRSVT